MTGPLDVVLLLTSFDVGGTERQMVELAKRLDPSRFRPHLACFHKRGRLVDEIPARDCRSASSRCAASATRPRDRPAHRRSPAGADRSARDIVHTCDLYGNIFGLPGAALAGVPVRIANRREILTGDKSRVQLTGAAPGLSRRARGRGQLERGARSARARGRAGRQAAPDRQRPRRPALHAGAGAAGIRARRDGRQPARRKGARHAARAPRHGSWRGIRTPASRFVGGGPRRDALETLTRALGIGDRVRFLGECRDVAPVLAEHDLFVLPSRSEAFPNALIEAMATGAAGRRHRRSAASRKSSGRASTACWCRPTTPARSPAPCRR